MGTNKSPEKAPAKSAAKSARSSAKKATAHAEDIDTPKARSLADDLRFRDDHALGRIFDLRSDLLHPVPTDIAQLATRSTTAPSVSAALDNLNNVELAVCEVLSALPDPSTSEQLHNALRSAQGYSEAAVDNALDSLLERALAWGSRDDIHLVRIARESFGAYPCGLATPFAEMRRTVREYAADSQLVLNEYESAPLEAKEIVSQLLWSTPVGSVKNAQRSVTKENAKSPIEWLIARDFLVPTSNESLVMPQEVSLALRGNTYLQNIYAQAPEPASAALDISRIDEAGAHSALEIVRLTESLLEAWSIEPPIQLKGGGLAIRDLTLSAELLKVSEHTAGLVIELASATGLINSDDDSHWLPTTAYDRWLGLDDAARWLTLAETWLTYPRAAHVIGGEATDRVNALSQAVDRNFIAPLRRQVLAIAYEFVGEATDYEFITKYLDWQRPRRRSLVRAAAVKGIVDEAQIIGFMAFNSLTTFGRALIDEGNAQELLTKFIPANVDHIIVQADLTALAPGRLPAMQRRTLSVLADVESTGVATTYRFSEKSIRRALDQGQSAHDIHEFLNTLSRTPLPQPLTYLIDDVARRHGALRVGAASVYLRSDDDQMVAQVLADRRLAGLKFRILAPGIIVSSAPADIVLEKLRSSGYAPMAESAEGAVLIHRPDTKRAGVKHIPTTTVTQVPTSRLIGAAVKALRSGERASDTAERRTDISKTTTSNTIAVLKQALEQNAEVWIGYADKSGITSERIVEPMTIAGGSLTAFDVRSNEVRTFTIARITGVEFLNGESHD